MEFDWKSFKKGTEERMGKSVESEYSYETVLSSTFILIETLHTPNFNL